MKVLSPRPTEIKSERLKMSNRPTKTVQEIIRDMQQSEKRARKHLKPLWRE